MIRFSMMNSRIIYKLLFLSFFSLMLIFISSCKKEDNPTDAQGANEIIMQNDQFVPATMTISSGTTIKWVNKDNHVHSVNIPSRVIASGEIKPNGEFSYTFNGAGDFDYFSNEQLNMVGTITVK